MYIAVIKKKTPPSTSTKHVENRAYCNALKSIVSWFSSTPTKLTTDVFVIDAVTAASGTWTAIVEADPPRLTLNASEIYKLYKVF